MNTSWAFSVLLLVAITRSLRGNAAPQPPAEPGTPLGDWQAFGGTRSAIIERGDTNDMRKGHIANGEPIWTAVFPGTGSAPNGQPKGIEAFRAPEALRNLSSAHPVLIRLVYQDGPAGVYQLTYDSNDSQVFVPGSKPGVGKPLPPFKMQGTGQWMLAQWTVNDPRFAGRLKGADLRLTSDRDSLEITGVFLETAHSLPPEVQPRAGIPKGDLIKFVFDRSRIFPGTTREITVYVPKQYNGQTPTCVWVDQDGMIWNDAAVLDNLIAQKEVPVMISIGIPPGKIVYPPTGNSTPETAPWSNRSFEYDTLSGDYVRFLTDEIFPAVEQLKTSDGRSLHLSRKASDCGISGASSGGICAFNAAWENPQAFSRVFSAIGSFDNIRNGDRYPGLIRKTEPKAIRVYLQDGANDLNWFAGDWSMANRRMDRALTWAGYEHEAVFGDGSHNGLQPFSVFADALRYLWKGWPNPVGTGATLNRLILDMFMPGEGWRKVWTGQAASQGLAVNAAGEVFFSDSHSATLRRIGTDGTVSVFASNAPGNGQMIFGSDGRLYRLEPGRIVAYRRNGEKTVFAAGIRGYGIAAIDRNRIYVSEPGMNGAPNRIWLFHADGSRTLVDADAVFAGSLSVDPPQHYLFMGDCESWVYRLQIQADGTLRYKERVSSPEVATVPGNAGVGGILALNGYLAVATPLGLQFCFIHNSDVNGSVMAIIPVPGNDAKAAVFGGPDFTTLYAACDDGIYQRKSRQHGPIPLARVIQN